MIGDHNPKGVSLLELLVVLGIFSLIIGTLIAVFINAVRIERRSLATQSILDNTRYTIELMARAIRQANPDTLPSGCETTCNVLQFTHADSQKGTVTYDRVLEGVIGRIQENSGTTGGPVKITASNINIQRLAFQVFGRDMADQQQPRVVITLTVSAASGTTPAMDIETTVSLRSPQE